jgi:1-acyl-sn-glycerol-3-phosphate acyltransferase
VQGLDHLARDRPCIIVANHSSYLDGFALIAALPLRFSFVAKVELRRKWAVRKVLERMDAEFVERFDWQRGVEDARRLVARGREGHSLLFFPEGTFTRVPGLRPFHMGAFLTAAEAGLPVVPVAICGTRSMLRPDSWFPRRGAISIRVGAPVEPAAQGGQEGVWPEALRLGAVSRDFILRHCGEPDLGHARES